MLKKPMKFGIKVWVLMDARFKNVFNFDVYCGASCKYGQKKGSEKGVERQQEM